MADIDKNTAVQIAESGTTEQVVDSLKTMVKVDRRVVSTKETIGYMLFDGSQGFNIDSQKELFVDSILKIGFDKQTIYQAIAGVWDIVDDLLIGGIVEKTRTRWGKFVPYLFLSSIPYAIIVGLYWLLPIIFKANIDDFDYIPKFIAYVVFEMLIEMVTNFRTVATSGYLSTITPFPSDRRRLLAVTKYLNLFYAGLPNTLVEFMLDFITNGILKAKEGKTEADMIKTALVTLGPLTAVVSGLVTLWYSTIAKERVHQSIDTPTIKQSLKLVFSNKPVLMYMISNALGSFGTGISTNNYYRWVLFMTTFETFAGIPSVAFQPFGYAKYNKVSARRSTKSIYMISQTIPKAAYIPVFMFGMFVKNKKGDRLFTQRWSMLPITAVWECIYAACSGFRSISGDEIRNECNDYIEWKCGYRNEATLSVASTILCKIPSRLNAILQPKIKQWIGYDLTAYTEVRPQPERAQKWIFAMATLIPAFLAIVSILPMLGYNIDKDTRDRMYMELNETRVKHAAELNAQNDD